MLELIQQIIFEVTGKKGVTYDTDFIQDLELNSFDIMNMISIFEDRYDISVPTRDVWPLKQVKDVIEYLRKRGITEP